MKYRNLGRTNFEVSEMGYGAWSIGGHQWLGADDRESLAALRRAIELGLNFIDTALAYGEGHSEQLVAQVVRDAGRRIYVATKVPPKNYLWPAQPGIGIEQVFPYQHILLSPSRVSRTCASRPSICSNCTSGIRSGSLATSGAGPLKS